VLAQGAQHGAAVVAGGGVEQVDEQRAVGLGPLASSARASTKLAGSRRSSTRRQLAASWRPPSPLPLVGVSFSSSTGTTLSPSPATSAMRALSTSRLSS
jgi:hypothetical protein